jgi:hypothetical protein
MVEGSQERLLGRRSMRNEDPSSCLCARGWSRGGLFRVWGQPQAVGLVSGRTARWASLPLQAEGGFEQAELAAT